MPPKSELFSVRISEGLRERIAEIVENRKENTPDYEDEPAEPEVHREILEAGVEAHEKGESDVSKLNRRLDELEKEKEELEKRLSNPSAGEWMDVTIRHIPALTFVIFAFLTVVGLVYLTALLYLEAESGFTLTQSSAKFILATIAFFMMMAIAGPIIAAGVGSIRNKSSGSSPRNYSPPPQEETDE